jgi:hypothetical protein
LHLLRPDEATAVDLAGDEAGETGANFLQQLRILMPAGSGRAVGERHLADVGRLPAAVGRIDAVFEPGFIEKAQEIGPIQPRKISPVPRRIGYRLRRIGD